MLLKGNSTRLTNQLYVVGKDVSKLQSLVFTGDSILVFLKVDLLSPIFAYKFSARRHFGFDDVILLPNSTKWRRAVLKFIRENGL